MSFSGMTSKNSKYLAIGYMKPALISDLNRLNITNYSEPNIVVMDNTFHIHLEFKNQEDRNLYLLVNTLDYKLADIELTTSVISND